MANSVDTIYIDTFNSNLRILAQQGESNLTNWVQISRDQSKSVHFDILGTMSMGAKTRAMDTPIGDAPWTRRKTSVASRNAGDLVENSDIVQTITDPRSGISQVLAKAAKRDRDSIIIAAATGTAASDTDPAIAFPAGQIIGNHTGEISFDLVTEVFEKFVTNDIDPDEAKVMVIGPKQLRKLQQIVQYTSSDYVNVKALAEKGYTPNWMGFTWVVSNLLGASGGVGTIDCFAMTKRAIGLHIPQDIFSRVEERADKSFAWQVYIEHTLGAVRVEDEQIVWMKLADTVT